jgi:putative ABC transport system substrate-binding protein
MKRQLVGWLGGASRQVAQLNFGSFLQGLHDYGYVEGRTVDLVERWADGVVERQPTLAEELVRLKPEVIVTANTAATLEVRRVTATIPVVCAILIDPIGHGLAASYSRPGGNVTGILITLDTLLLKQVQLLAQLIPAASSIGILANESDNESAAILREAESTARTLSLTLVPVEVRSAEGLDAAFDKLKRLHVDGVVVLSDSMFFTQARRIIALADAARLPAIHSYAEHVEAGGLISYGVEVPQNYRRTGYFVDKILKGNNPAELPIEFPTKLQLVINLKTANALGLTIPETLLATADEVIQ